MARLFQLGDRVRVASRHLSVPGRTGTIVEIHDRTGNRFVIKFDKPEIGLYSEDIKVMTVDQGEVTKKGPPILLRLGDIDLEWLPPGCPDCGSELHMVHPSYKK